LASDGALVRADEEGVLGNDRLHVPESGHPVLTT
jgi:hypothetical protein